MKSDRNFIPYPMYPPYQNMGPMPFGMPSMNVTTSCSENNDLEKRLNELEKRISNLEKMINISNYNGSNYQML